MPSPLLPNRRQCLRAAGASLTLPFLASFPGSKTWARQPVAGPGAGQDGPTDAAPRMVCMGVALSMYPGEWNPARTGSDYEAPKLIKPLEHLRKEFTLISNADHPGVTGGHKGTPAFLSGVYKPERIGQAIIVRNQITLDQVAARALGGKTRYASLQLGAADIGPNDSLSWNEKGIPLPAMADPLELYRELFVNEKSPEKAARSLSQGRSVLDLVNADAKRLSSQLSSADKQRLDQYMTSVRGVETDISRQIEWLGTPKPKVARLKDRPTSYHENLDTVLELAALALQTGLTRVISVGLPGNGLPIMAGKQRIGNYHGQSHHGKDASVVAQLVEIETMHSKSLARFLDRLKSIPTTEGNLLDCTQVLFGSGLGNASSHSNRDLPILLAGGGFQHGKHVRLKEKTPLCNLFVSMLQRLGVEQDAFAGSTGNVNEFLGA